VGANGRGGPNDSGLFARLGEVKDPVALLAGIFAHSPVAFQVYRADGHSLLTNRAFRDLFGSEPPPEYNVLEDDIARARGVLEPIRSAFRGETVHLPPMWYDPRDLQQVEVTAGKRVSIEATFFPLCDAAGTVEHVAVVFRNLTAESELREQAERERDLLTRIIEQSGDGVIVCDADGRLAIFNRQAERQHGVSLSRVSPASWTDMYGLLTLDGQPLATEETALYRALRGETVERARWMVERPDGSRRILSGTAVPLEAGDGSQAGAVLITRDETDQLEDERRMRFQATVLRNIRDSVIVTDLEGRIIEWNQGAWEVFGYRADEVLGKTPAILYPDLDPVTLAADLGRIAEGHDHAGEWLGRRKDGSELWIDVKTTLVRDEIGRPVGFLGIGKDVTDRRRAEAARADADRERERALALAESASRTKDEFLAMLGHELRNPLAPIVTALDLMKLRSSSPTSREEQVIERQVEHLVRLVDDLLDVSRITRGKVELDCRAIDLQAAVVKAVEMAAPLFEQRRHRFRVDVPTKGMRLHADVARLAQIISNLLTNAARYTPPGGSIALTARREGDFVVLSVADTGIGIDPALLPHVFDLFVQGERSMERADGGLGIGLTLVQNLVRLHGGTVEAVSDGRGRGSEFIVRLPALPDDAPRRAPTAPPLPLGTIAPRRIIVVDDNVDAADLTAELLARAGHEVHVAHDGPAALSLAQRVRPEVALLDIGLPVMNGYELADRLRATFGPRAPRLIAITGYGQDHDHARSEAAGFDDHLVKPVPPAVLLARIDSLPLG
jgi:PAS domain S-box-containing protein